MMTPETVDAATKTVTTASIINHLKNNRVELALACIFLHLLGVSDRVLAQVSGVCF